MRIKSVEVIPLLYTVKKPFMDAFGYASKRSVALVKIETDDGITGYGEAATYGGSLHAVAAVIRNELEPLLVGLDPMLKDMLWKRMYKKCYQHGRAGVVIGAISGVDIALWDITGKVAGMPLYKLLGGFTDRVRAYASGGFYREGQGVGELVEEMKGYVREGFTAVKLKIGRTPGVPGSSLPLLPEGHRCNVSLEEDIERVKAVREAIGRGIELLVDANNAWDVKTAVKMARALEKYDVYYIEEPVLTEDVEGSARIAASTTIAIAGYETAYTRYEYKKLITEKAVDIVQPNPLWAGGMSECMKIASMAAAYNLPVIPHGFGSAICTAANLHFLASIANGVMIEFDRNENPFMDELITRPYEVEKGGYIRVPDGPGLGISINEDAVEKYRVEI